MAKLNRMFAGMINVKRLMWHPESREFSGELSDLGWHAGEEKFERVYPDACDVGLTLHNSDTNEDAVFYLSREEVREGDLLWYELLPTPESIKKHPRLNGVKLRLFND